MSVAKEFRDFVLRGNVVDLGVGIVIGGAFGTITSAFVKDLITPLIGIVAGRVDLANLHAHVGRVDFAVGEFLNAVITFLLIALVVFFAVVKPYNFAKSRIKPEPGPAPTTHECPFCLTQIPLRARRCPACTSEVSPQGA